MIFMKMNNVAYTSKTRNREEFKPNNNKKNKKFNKT